MALLVSFIVFLVVVSRVGLAEVHFGDMQGEYDGFLDLIENNGKSSCEYGPCEQIETLESMQRQNDHETNHFFANNKDMVKFDKDRFQQAFVTCMQGDESRNEQPRSIRCMQRSSQATPACMITHDYTHNTTMQSCHEVPQGAQSCADKCEVTVSSFSAQHNTGIKTVVGYCCCTSLNCNYKQKEKLDVAYIKFIHEELKKKQQEERDQQKKEKKQHHHHHHHHHHKNIRSFDERLYF